MMKVKIVEYSTSANVKVFKDLHRSQGHMVIGMPTVPGEVPGWAKCLTCDLIVEDRK